MELNELITLAVDMVKGRVDRAKFSEAQDSKELVAAIIDLNGGKTKISARDFRPGNPVFELVEELVPVIIDEGIKRSENPLFNLVEYRNIGYGDEAAFDVEGDGAFVVAEAAAGIRDVRRQKMVGGERVDIKPVMKAIRVYEDLGKLLAHGIDFVKFIDAVQRAFEEYISECAYEALSSITASTTGLSATYVKSGSITEANLLTLVEHVEAATGKPAMILGTKTALRKLGSSVSTSAELNSDLYNLGFYGRIAGVPCVAFRQAHKAGTETFVFDDDALWIISGDSKPIKVVNGGEGYMSEREATSNADLTKEYAYFQPIGVGVVVNEKFGYWYSIA